MGRLFSAVLDFLPIAPYWHANFGRQLAYSKVQIEAILVGLIVSTHGRQGRHLILTPNDFNFLKRNLGMFVNKAGELF